jgi:uracil-DNA glycosylase
MAKDETDSIETDQTRDPAEELASLVGALRSHLGWLNGRGVSHLAAAPSPRFSEPVEELMSEPDPVTPGLTSPMTLPAEGRVEDLARPRGAAQAPLGSPEDLASLASPGIGAAGLARIRECLGDCHRCGLSQDRVQVVFGQGNPDADLLLVGEAPGRDEDLAGVPFVGAAGKLLTKMLKAMGFERDQVYIGNVIKCRPPRNRNPLPDELARCEPFLLAQIRAIRPKIIVTLGRFAAQELLRTDESIGSLRGRLHTVTLDGREMALAPTYHPAYLLRNASAKRPVWEDLQRVMAWLKEHDSSG